MNQMYVLIHFYSLGLNVEYGFMHFKFMSPTTSNFNVSDDFITFLPLLTSLREVHFGHCTLMFCRANLMLRAFDYLSIS